MTTRLNYFKNKPKVSKIDVATYLKRLNLSGEAPSLSFLRKLHRAHLLIVPFENLDIHYRQKIVLDYELIFKKIIVGRRGGYCYELNGLFYHLLYHLGFDVKVISAQVFKEEEDAFGKAFGHMALLIKLEENSYLADVGFGECIVFPKMMKSMEVQMDHVNYWRLEEDADHHLVLKSSADAIHFKTQYRFSTQPKELIQFMEMNEYYQTNVSSSFTQGKLITRLTESGRITLTDRKFSELKLGKKLETEIQSEDEFLAVLQQHFGISYRDLNRIE
ncbi:MAG: arylamine N-acetyltransferase [Bacteroidota bacterium]